MSFSLPLTCTDVAKKKGRFFCFRQGAPCKEQIWTASISFSSTEPFSLHIWSSSLTASSPFTLFRDNFASICGWACNFRLFQKTILLSKNRVIIEKGEKHPRQWNLRRQKLQKRKQNAKVTTWIYRPDRSHQWVELRFLSLKIVFFLTFRLAASSEGARRNVRKKTIFSDKKQKLY